MNKAKRQTNAYDGYHLRGDFASRHFTYRAIKAIKPVISNYADSAPTGPGRNNFCPNTTREPNFHDNCPQTQYQRNQLPSSHTQGQIRRTYSEVTSSNKRSNDVRYAVPTSNYYIPLN